MFFKCLIFLLIMHSCYVSGQVNDGSTVPKNAIGQNPQPKTIEAVPPTGTCTTCVPYYLCYNGTINTDGAGIIDIRSNSDSSSPCESYLEVCCAEGKELSEPIIPSPPLVNRTGCGYRNPDGVGFRLTGNKDQEASFGEFPWMVAILRQATPRGEYDYQCGAALIHPKVVLTAAHCVANDSATFKIRAGEWDTQTTQEVYPHQEREVSSITIHPQYNHKARNLHNDIALLILKSPVEISENVDVACLPPADTVVDNVSCYVSGWGKDVFGREGKRQVILKKIDVPMVPKDRCQGALRTTRLSSFFRLDQSFVCAGGRQAKDVCTGDGGSPLVCPISGQTDRYFQAGIVSWGVGCGESGIPGVYVNVALFRSWIDEEMVSNRLDVESYQY